MKSLKIARWSRLALIVALTPTAIAGGLQAAPPVVDVIGNMSNSQYNSFIAPQSYRDWGNEPFIAVNPTNTSQIVISGFGYGTSSTSNGASLWYSTNGGSNWTMTFPFQSPSNGVQIPRDQIYAYDNSGKLHGTILGSNGSNLNIYHGTTTTPGTNVSATFTAGTVNQFGTNNVDQPHMAISGSRVYVAYDNFNSGGNVRVALSTDGGTTFTAANDRAISTYSPSNSFTNPGVRIAADSAGNAYAIFGQGVSSLGSGVQNVDFRLNRFQVANGTWDTTNGVQVAQGNSHQIDSSGKTWFGGVNELRGNTTAIAVTQDGSHVYTVFGIQDGSGLDRLYMREFHDVGGTLVGSTPVLFSVSGERAALPSIAVSSDGTIFIEYDSYVGPGGDPLAKGGTFQAHLATSTDGGLTFTDALLYSWSAEGTGGNRELGDYQFLLAVGNSVYGTFAAGGDTTGNNNTTRLITPFFFTTQGQAPVASPVVPEPSSMVLGLLLLSAFGSVMFVRCKRKPVLAATC